MWRGQNFERCFLNYSRIYSITYSFHDEEHYDGFCDIYDVHI